MHGFEGVCGFFYAVGRHTFTWAGAYYKLEGIQDELEGEQYNRGGVHYVWEEILESMGCVSRSSGGVEMRFGGRIWTFGGRIWDF